MADNAKLEYDPFDVCIIPSFWNKLAEIKLNVDKLSEDGRKIWGWYSNQSTLLKPFIEVDSTSFNTDFEYNDPSRFPISGSIYNKNTIENFKECDKQALIEQEGAKLWQKIETGEVLKNPIEINAFFALAFADLKKYNFYYWFAFPALASVSVQSSKVQFLEKSSAFKDEILRKKLTEAYKSLYCNNKVLFFVKKNDVETALKLEDIIQKGNNDNLADFDDYYIVYADPGRDEENPGWPLRNIVTTLLYYCPKIYGQTLSFIGLRFKAEGKELSTEGSLLIELLMPEFSDGDFKKSVFGAGDSANYWVGWIRNERGKLGPKLAKLQSSMDPKCLVKDAVDLNLKLMKWRILPEINLERINQSKCLLLGAGTLGCAVARTLLGWGVATINFVDNSTVSLSNPVRQSLYTFEDSTQHKPKVEAAAENLKKIYPGVISNGFQISIPMPGHAVTEAELDKTKTDVQKLTELISNHDIIFLLMDSRESRWLPTLLGCYFGKIVINAALGFDTYLIMRHGIRDSLGVDNEAIRAGPSGSGDDGNVDGVVPKGFKSIAGKDLGCYFCNDITAPGNSMKDRTLDQQCTVTRPGLSSIAGALAVELAISLLEHKDGGGAPALYKPKEDPTEVFEEQQCSLGILPHSIRGFLASFRSVMPAMPKAQKCIACSDKVLSEYKTRSFDFLLEVFNNGKYLEELVGLDYHQGADGEDGIWEMDDDDEEDLD